MSEIKEVKINYLDSAILTWHPGIFDSEGALGDLERGLKVNHVEILKNYVKVKMTCLNKDGCRFRFKMRKPIVRVQPHGCCKHERILRLYKND